MPPKRRSDSSSTEAREGPKGEPPSGAPLSVAQLHGLVRLLADDDPRILATVRRHLLQAMDLARPLLEERARQSDNERLRAEARRLLEDARREERLRAWESFAQGQHLDLETGVFLIAQVEYPDLDPAPYKKILDDCAQILQRRLPAQRSAETVIAKLNHLLFRDMGFEGNREDYSSPDNSFIHRVLDRKLGIPISLSVVAMLVAKRLDFELEGLGLPGHFLLRHREGRKEIIFDPFNGGRSWSLEDCLQHLRNEGLPLESRYLEAMSPRRILNRCLENLLHVYAKREDDERQQRVARMQRALERDNTTSLFI
jgi:regulator of sirC expression with transglutaminase-like and TPR domain